MESFITFFFSGLGGALIGSVITHWFGIRQQANDRRRNYRGLIAMLQTELATIDQTEKTSRLGAFEKFHSKWRDTVLKESAMVRSDIRSWNYDKFEKARSDFHLLSPEYGTNSLYDKVFERMMGRDLMKWGSDEHLRRLLLVLNQFMDCSSNGPVFDWWHTMTGDSGCHCCD